MKIRLVSNFSPGGSIDITKRTMTEIVRSKFFI
ncbi:hypothetical protein BB65665_12067 [Bacillus sp. 916]|nr:hypothetical protein BB65665_12067 [Bacillus sp. 916]